jgi:hypothetical protein
MIKNLLCDDRQSNFRNITGQLDIEDGKFQPNGHMGLKMSP